MILPQSSARISRMKAEGAARRASLLSLLPTEFTSGDVALVGCLTPDAARAQVQKMVKWKEIEPTSAYRTPRTYRRILK